MRRAQHSVHRVLERVAHHHWACTVADRVHHRNVSLFFHRHIRVLVRRDRREQPLHENRLRVGRHTAFRHHGLPGIRLFERQARFRRRVRPDYRDQRDRPDLGLIVRLRHVRTVQIIWLSVQDHI